jgi:acyl-coenzyme A thioesterase PaaI-like protein
MDVTALPYNRRLGLEAADAESGWLVSLPASPDYLNHLGTVHAGALLSVAEAGSAVFLSRHLGDATGFVPVVRRLESKFRKPARGRVSARAAVEPGATERWATELRSKGRALIAVPVEVVDEAGVVAVVAVVEWFITRGGASEA